MGVDDRDWYNDVQRRRIEKEYRYDPKQFRSDSEGPPLPGAAGTIWRTVVYCLAIYGALTLLQHAHYHFGGLSSSTAQNPLVQVVSAR